MATRGEVIEALQHTWHTRHRLAAQPGTHRARADLGHQFDSLLDQLLSLSTEDDQPWHQVPSGSSA